MSHLRLLARQLSRISLGDGVIRGSGSGVVRWVGPLIQKAINPAGDWAGAPAILSEMQLRDQGLAAYPLDVKLSPFSTPFEASRRLPVVAAIWRRHSHGLSPE